MNTTRTYPPNCSGAWMDGFDAYYAGTRRDITQNAEQREEWFAGYRAAGKEGGWPHTPGPWAVGGSLISARGCFAVAVVLHSFEPVETRTPRDYDRDATNVMAEFDANARLISAAPDLLQAAQWAVEEYVPERGFLPPEMIEHLRSAILKAEGGAS